ncbi:MAG TPA: hypothetical protein VLU96_04655 [Gaiellaceae bacterium]|nr:hypothetical protein [Gaiellaceae bacterium]
MGAALALSSVGQGWLDGWLAVGLGALGLAGLAVGLVFRWSAALAFGIALLGAEQAVRLAAGPRQADPWIPLYAIAFLFTAELAWWSIEPRVAAWAESEVAGWRLVTIGLACAGAGLLGALVLLAAGTPVGGGIGLELVGVVAATAAVVVVAVVARSRRFG